MTKLEARNLAALAPIMQAYSEGKTIQSYSLFQQKWIDLENPTFEADPHTYRIKPEPPAPREKWIVERRLFTGDIILSTQSRSDRDSAEEYGRRAFGDRFVRVVKFVEVVE